MSQTPVATGLTIQDVANRQQLSYWTVYRLVRSGRIGHYRVGGSIRISEEQYRAYLRSVEHKPLRAVK